MEKTRGRIDALNDIVYSQVKSTVAVRQLHMSLLVPRNGDLKPAIIYFPGGGFTSAAWNKFIEMRMALAAAGFVVAAAEYRTVPDTSRPRLSMVKPPFAICANMPRNTV
ncbi:lipase/esterase [Klebsiella michiganensis]|nr:lipase/esterase [Klebsiella michiganensis]